MTNQFAQEEMMAIKFFCDRCGKEIWQGLTTERRIAALSERECVCSDCMLDEAKRGRESDSESLTPCDGCGNQGSMAYERAEPGSSLCWDACDELRKKENA